MKMNFYPALTGTKTPTSRFQDHKKHASRVSCGYADSRQRSESSRLAHCFAIKRKISGRLSACKCLIRDTRQMKVNFHLRTLITTQLN